MNAAAKPAMAECPSCDGDGHHGVEPETGCLYACYCCGTTGRVTQAERDAHDAEEAAYLAANPPAPAYVAPPQYPKGRLHYGYAFSDGNEDVPF